jgi:hypothetical protein
MRTIAFALVSMLALPLTAAAQPGASPYYATPPPAQPVAVAPAEPKVRLEVGLIAASPRGDWEQLEAESSPGFGLSLGFRVSRGVELFGGLRYVRVEYDEEALGLTDFDIEISHRELQLGVRFTTDISPGAKAFVEGNLHSATLTASVEGDSNSESGLGVGARGGLIFMADQKIGIGVAVGYSSAEITADAESSEEFEDAWVTGDAFVTFWF